MEIIVAKHAGFCYGVRRAFDMTLDFKREDPEKKVYTYGELIHNPQVLSALEEQGIFKTEDLDLVESKRLVIRAHGVDPKLIEEAKKKGFQVKDATCPYVRKIHILAKKAYDRGDLVVIIGDAAHPEVIGIKGNCADRCRIISGMEEAKSFIQIYLEGEEKRPFTVLAQTTYNEAQYREIIEEFRKNINIFTEFNTICSSTEERQRELKEMAEICDFFIVLGGKHSSNTKKLYEILKKMQKKAVHIEKKSEITFELFEKCDRIGVVAGASTPQESIDEIVDFLANRN